MKPSLSNKYRTAFVTGASAGLGSAFVKMLLAEGIQVWGTSRDISRLQKTDGFRSVELNLNQPLSEIESIYRSAESSANGFDIVINNAGYGVFDSFADLSPDIWQRQLREMLEVPLFLSHLAFGSMRKAGKGALVNVSSLAVEFPLPFMSGYNVVKAGLTALSESLMVEAARSGVIVIDFRPGDYRTDFNRSMYRPLDTAGRAQSSDAKSTRGKAWTTLERNLNAAPHPDRAAKDLRAALNKGRSAMVRSGSFFQATIAPLLSRFASSHLRRAVQARYFGTY